MKSKEALKYLLDNSEELYSEYEEDIKFYLDDKKLYNIVLKDLNRLEKLDDLEEKIGIDLITLLKALESGVWIKEWKEPIKHTCGLKFSKYGKYWILENKTYCLDLKEYGKTWALTKEVLGNE